MDYGTICQLRNLLNRKNVPSKPKNDLNAYEDFMLVVGIGHIIAVARQLLQTESFDTTNLTVTEKNKRIHEFAEKMVGQHINHHLLDEESLGTADGVLDYTREVLTLSLLYAEYHDAIRESDGLRLLRCWKFLLPVVKASGRKNYSLAVLHSMAQYYILLPPRLAQQLLWSLCINTAGRPGCNIPMDLHMEHLNRSCKSAIANLKANVVPSAIVRIGKCLGPLTSLCDAFSKASNVNPHSSAHSEAKFHDDLEKIVTELMKNEVFSYFPNRKHTSLPNFHGSLLDKINSEQMKDYIKKHLKKFKNPCMNNP